MIDPGIVKSGIGLWFGGHMDLFALAIAAAGFALRIAAARGAHLSGDESLDFQLVNRPRLADVYQATLDNAHPPFFFILLHFWRLLGTSELFLRLLPIVFGTLLLWVTYRWALSLYGRAGALMTLTLLSFSPAFVALSSQVRGYTLAVFLMAASALTLERALGARAAGWIAISSTFLALAVLTHYSAIIFWAALSIYALIRLKEGRAERPQTRVFTAWAVSQLAVGVVFGCLAVTHLSHLRGSELERGVKASMLRAEYFQADQDRPIPFLVRQTAAVFRFLSGSQLRGLAALVLAAAGVILLARRKQPSALLLTLPFFLNAIAALLGFYPYGGVRQSVYLLLFASAAIGATVAAIAAARPGAGLALVPVLAFATLTVTVPVKDGRAQMTETIATLRANASSGSLLFVDRRAGNVLDYYLGRDAWSTARSGREGFWESSAGGYRIIGSPIWNFTGYRLGTELQRLVTVYGLPPGQTVWLINVESNLDLPNEVHRQFPRAILSLSLRFHEISLLETVLP